MTARAFAMLEVADEAGSRHITLKNPARKNAIGPVMVNELLWALSDAAIIRQWPWLMPMTSHSEPGGMMRVWSWSDSTWPGMPPSTLTMNENWSGCFRMPMSRSGQIPLVWPVSKHSSSGFTPEAFIASSIFMILP